MIWNKVLIEIGTNYYPISDIWYLLTSYQVVGNPRSKISRRRRSIDLFSIDKFDTKILLLLMLLFAYGAKSASNDYGLCYK